MEEELLHPDAENEHEKTAGAFKEAEDARIPNSIKYTITVLLICFGIAIGSTGHSVYSAHKGNSANYVQHYGKMLSRMNTTRNPCYQLYHYACGAYAEEHMPLGGKSIFKDMQEKTQTIAYREFDAHVAKHPETLASLFYKRCQSDPYEIDDSGCAISGAPGPALTKNIIEHGYPINGIYADRTTNPYARSVRTFSLILESYTSGSSAAPLQISTATDPCAVFELRDIVFNECEHRACEDEILVYGNIDELCAKWSHARRNLTQTSAEARNNATALCEYETRWSRRHYASETCMLHTSRFYPDVSLAMISARKWDTAHVRKLFEEIQKHTTKLVTLLGDGVAKKISQVTLNAGWTSQNLNPGPPRIAFSNVSYSKLYMTFRAWVQRDIMAQKVMISPLFQMEAWEMNAYYAPSENSIYIPDSLQILEKKDNTEFSSGLAFILAHELAHSFDISSVQYDENGMFVGSLLDEEAQARYNRYINCIRTNRPRQLAEDFADNIAAQVVMNLQDDHRLQTATFDGVKWTSSQQSLIEMAQLWCEAERPLSFSDSHSPATMRVDETLSTVVHVPFDCPFEHVCRL